jgi:hypothetical protein
MAELGFPLPRRSRDLVRAGTPFIKLVRTFADPAAGHTGIIYKAAGAWYLGTTRAEAVWVGRRTGEKVTRRSISKLLGHGHGHVHQVLRAAFEGSAATAVLLAPDGESRLAVINLRDALAATPMSDGAELRRTLLARWRSIRSEVPENQSGTSWLLTADVAGYTPNKAPPKHLYATYLGTPFWAAQLLRHCRRLRDGIRAAEAAWLSGERRRPRGHGFGWPRRPAALGRPRPPSRN